MSPRLPIPGAEERMMYKFGRLFLDFGITKNLPKQHAEIE
jgi:hypothetical protein